MEIEGTTFGTITIDGKTYGHLEKLLPLAIADSSGVNVNESERERSGIIRGQFYGVWRGGAIFRGAHVYKLLRSKDARVRRAAFTLLETSNPRLRRRSELFIEITRFIWDANPSYEVYQEFTKRHFQARYKVHQLIDARLKIEKQEKQSAAVDDLAGNTPQYEGGFFNRLFRRRSGCSQRKPKSSLPLGMTTEVIE